MLVHCTPLWSCWHAPLTQLKPVGHVFVASQPDTHCPSAHILPSPHSLENLHTFAGAVHAPPTHCAPPEQSLCELHGHGPFEPPHAWQWLATHALPLAQSAVVLQPFVVHVPPTHLSPGVVQSVCAVHGHAALLPPHAWQLPLLHVLPGPQSPDVVHSLGAPASAPGGAQVPEWQTVPRGQSLVAWQVCSQPALVHTWPGAQLLVPVQG